MIDRRSLIKHSGAAIAALGAGMTAPSLRALAATAVLPRTENGRSLNIRKSVR
jgi:TAT (twin-arginine translocation) pathway signal sequence